MKIKFLLAFAMLTIFSCSTDTVDVSFNENTIDANAETKLTLVNSSSLGSTPFFEPRETIVYMNNLYAIDKQSTYKYSFQSNLWQQIINTNNEDDLEIASHPSDNSNFSFIRDDKWYVLSNTLLSSYSFETRSWNIEKQFSENEGFNNPTGIYSNGELYVFSGDDNVVYTYDFQDKTFEMHADLDLDSNYAQLVNSVFKVSSTYFYARLSDYKTISLYVFNDQFDKVEYLGDYVKNNFDKGAGFVYDKKIIFGLGGDFTNGTEATIHNSFEYYDTKTDEFKTVSNQMYESRYIGLPIRYNNAHYLLGGTTIINGEKTPKNTIDKLEFALIAE